MVTVSVSRPLPAFSFLTTAYRTEPYLVQTIESVRGQTRTDWELIVVDNGRSDEIAAIVRSYASDSRIRLVRQENRGYEGGVTAAAALARGQYFCVLDSDDLLMPDFCARTGTVLAADRGIDAVGCDAFLFDDHGGTHKGYLRSIGFRTRPHPGHPLTLTDMLAGYIPYYTGAVSARGVECCMRVRARDTGSRGGRGHVAAARRLRIRRANAPRTPRALPGPEGLGIARPRRVEAFDRRIQRSFQTVVHSTSRAEDLDALRTNLQRLRYHQAMRQARRSLLEGDLVAARVEAKAAFAQRHTLRAAWWPARCPSSLRRCAGCIRSSNGRPLLSNTRSVGVANP